MSSWRPMLVTQLAGVLVLCSVLLSLNAPTARADVGVQPILPGGSSIRPGDATPIQMVSEEVTMSIRAATEADNGIVALNPDAYGFQYFEWAPLWFTAVAEVHADFQMSNPTGDDLTMDVWFPLASALESIEWELNPDEVVPRIQGLHVEVDDAPVPLTVSEWPNPKGEDRPPLPWASFPVTFPAAARAHIQVDYSVPAERTLDDVGMRFYYVFQTGAGWAGPIGKAKFVVRLPYPASPDTIGEMPEGGQLVGQEVTWIWEDLEPGPADDFAIWLLLPERWEALTQARATANADPENGEAWLALASTYHRLILGKYRVLPGFGETFRPLGTQAATQAIALLPGDGRPHYELAMFYLSALAEDSSEAELKPFLDELQLVEELDPSYAGDLHDWFEFIMGIDSWSGYWAARTATAPNTQTPPASRTPFPTSQPQLSPTAPQAPGTADSANSWRLPVLAVVASITVGAAFLLRRRRATHTKTHVG